MFWLVYIYITYNEICTYIIIGEASLDHLQGSHHSIVFMVQYLHQNEDQYMYIFNNCYKKIYYKHLHDNDTRNQTP